MDPRRTTSASSSSAVASAFRMITLALELGPHTASPKIRCVPTPSCPCCFGNRHHVGDLGRRLGLGPEAPEAPEARPPHGIDAQRAPHGQQHIALLRGRLRPTLQALAPLRSEGNSRPPLAGCPQEPGSARRKCWPRREKGSLLDTPASDKDKKI